MGEEGARQTKNLPLFCLANYNAFKHTVITISNLVIILSLNYLRAFFHDVLTSEVRYLLTFNGSSKCWHQQ